MLRLTLSLIFILSFFSVSILAQPVNTRLLSDLLDLPAPAPTGAKIEASSETNNRPPEFYSPKNVPPDDAPIEELLDYWMMQNSNFDEFRYNIKPSKESLRRILDAVEQNPEKLTGYLKLLPAEPEIADLVKRLYQDELQVQKLQGGWSNPVRSWLRNNSDMFVNELLQGAREVRFENNYLRNQEDLINLAMVDWNRAKSLIDGLEGNRGEMAGYTLAKYILYHRALKTESTGDIEKYRDELKKIVEDKTAPHKARDLAMDALVLGGDFAGRKEWYLSLLGDETLLELQENGFTGLTTLPRHSPNSREEWIPQMIELVEKGTPAQRSAAIRNLIKVMGEDSKEILKLMLPWLTDANWAKASDDRERENLLEALGEADLPESVPGLLAVLINEDGGNRALAAKALIKYKPLEAIPVLRSAVRNETSYEYRATLIEALIALGGLSDDEQMAALESYAALISTEDGKNKLEQYEYGYSEEEEDEKPLPVEISIGKYVAEQETPTDGLVMRAVERLKLSRKSNPLLAVTLEQIVRKWSHRTADLELFKWIAEGKADIETVLNVLAKREQLKARIPNELLAMQSREGLPRGLSAVILNDKSEMSGILAGSNADTQIALLAAARLVRAKLVVSEVARHLNSPNKTLGLAAERYLESEDSAEARTLILAKYPNEARILGARKAFVPNEKTVYQSEALDGIFESVNNSAYQPFDYSKLNKAEDSLRDEVRQNPDLLAVYAIVENGESGHEVIRVFKNRITYTFYEDAARFQERLLSAEEYETFYRFLIEKQIDSQTLPADECSDCEPNEFIMFGRGGGRRVFFPLNYGIKPVPLDKLFEFFERFRQSDLKLHYRLADKISGLEVLLAQNEFTARAVWSDGSDLRVLVEDNEKRKAILEDIERQEKMENAADTLDTGGRNEQQRRRRMQSAYKHFSWRQMESGKLAETETSQPAAVPFLSGNMSVDYYMAFLTPEPRTWTARAGGTEMRSIGGDLYKIAPDGTQVLIKEGTYLGLVVTPDGKWAASSSRGKNYEEPNHLLRINLQTGKEFKVNLPAADIILPIAFVASHGKILLMRARGERQNQDNDEADKTIPNPKTPEYYLLDPNTGVVQPVKGVFEPLERQSFRGLQPTGAPGEYWAAIYDKEKKTTNVGRYSDKTFVFKPVMQIPEIELDSMDIWVSEPEAKIYFVYSGHLLALPIPK